MNLLFFPMAESAESDEKLLLKDMVINPEWKKKIL